ncbi:MAG: ATP-binding protein [Propionibacteriaceae bacterium]|jgi:predicted AAA+ superfamily ATPase|nr:ATP-binding protein [Propionibacteriaceae bacterium]
MIPRPRALEHLVRYRDTEHLVKVIAGVRRCGKSTLLDMFRDELLADGVAPESLFTANFERFELASIDSAAKLHEFVTSHPFPDGKRYILLDEVQLVPGWERVVNSLRLDPLNDLYITGSNVRLLGSELATILSGRYVRIDTFPLSFDEYLTACPADGQTNRRQRFAEYLRTGGLPGLFGLPDDDQMRREYLDGVLSTILVKDIAQTHAIRDIDALEKIIRYLAANIGSPMSARSIANYLTSSGRRISAETVDNYLRLLEDAFLFYRARRLDLKSKELMRTNEKFYLTDLGFRSILFGMGSSDVGHALENVVYFELRRRGYNVSVGRHNSLEVDFVATKPESGTHYYQVTQSMADPATADRELAALRAVQDHFPRTILSLDEIATRDYEGIAHTDVIDFLLEE